MYVFSLLTALTLLTANTQNKTAVSAFSSKPGVTPPAIAASKISPAVPLTFREMFDVTPDALKPTEKLLSLVGKRVRLTGFMAAMEQPPLGGFYLCSFPVNCDESGGGIGDLPPNAVFVVVRSAGGKPLPGHIGRPLIVSGTLELGARTEPNGYVTHIRLFMDRETDLSPAERAAVKTPPANRKTRRTSKRRNAAKSRAAQISPSSDRSSGSSSKP